MAMLDTFKSLFGHIYLDGALCKGAGSEGGDAIDPATEEVNGELTFTSASEVDEAVAVAVAKKARVEWNRMGALARSEELHEVAHRLRGLIPKMAEAATREKGQALQGNGQRGALDRRGLRLLRRDLAP